MFSKGMTTFTIIWFGQLISMIGTAMTRFALLIWAYQQSHNATSVALLGFFSLAPFVLASPLAGVWVDRLNRRLLMMVTDLGAGAMTVILLALYVSGKLEVWHLFAAGALTGIFEAFQVLAYNTAITVLIPKNHYVRASGMRSVAESASQIVGPFLAGTLLAFVGINGVMWIDIVTFAVAFITLLIVRIPSTPGRNALQTQYHTTWQEMRVGFNYIGQQPGLLGTLLIYSVINFLAGLTYFGVLPAMILARTGSDQLALAGVQAALGIGGVLGGVLLSVWGGPKRLIHGILAGGAISFLVGDLLLAVGRSTPVWLAGAFIGSFFVPFIVGANRAIWQKKVPPALQGRVFSIKFMLQTASLPLGYLLAGPLADHIFEPALAANGLLVHSLAWLVGSGPGAGMGLMFACTAIFGMLTCLSGYAVAAVRRVEEDLPDYDTPAAAAFQLQT